MRIIRPVTEILDNRQERTIDQRIDHRVSRVLPSVITQLIDQREFGPGPRFVELGSAPVSGRDEDYLSRVGKATLEGLALCGYDGLVQFDPEASLRAARTADRHATHTAVFEQTAA